MKLKFKLGQPYIIILLGLFSFYMPVLFYEGASEELKSNQAWFFYFMLIFVITIIILWRRIFNKFLLVELDNSSLKCHNVITRKKWIIEHKDVSGYEHDYSNGYTIYLINHKQETLLALSKTYYRNFTQFEQTLGYYHFGKRKNLISRMIEKWKTNA